MKKNVLIIKQFPLMMVKIKKFYILKPQKKEKNIIKNH